MLEGGGKTPILNPTELEEVGYKIVVYPLSLIGVSIRAMQVWYLHLVSLILQVSGIFGWCHWWRTNIWLENLICIIVNLSFKCELKHDPSCLNTWENKDIWLSYAITGHYWKLWLLYLIAMLQGFWLYCTWISRLCYFYHFNLRNKG